VPITGQVKPSWHFVQLKLPAETASRSYRKHVVFCYINLTGAHRFRKINPRYHASMDGIAIPSRGNKEIDLLSQNNFVSRMKTCVAGTACLQKMQQSSLVTMYNSEIRRVKDSWHTLRKNKMPIQSLSSLAEPNKFLSWKHPPTSSVGRLVVRPAVAFATLM